MCACTKLSQTNDWILYVLDIIVHNKWTAMLLQFHRTLHIYCYNLWLVFWRRNGRRSAFSVL